MGIIPRIRGELGNEVPEGGAPFVSGVLMAVGAQPLWRVMVKMQTWALSISRGWNCPGWQRQTPRWQGSLVLRLKLRRLGFGYGHPWCLEVIKKQEKGWPGPVGMHVLGTCADVRAEILSSKHRIQTSSQSLWTFVSGSNLVAGRSA